MPKPFTSNRYFPSRSAGNPLAGIALAAVVVVTAAALIFGSPSLRPARADSPVSIDAQAASATTPAIASATRARINASFAALPLAFEANQGQVDPQVKYLARGNGYKLYLTSSHADMKLSTGIRDSEVLDMIKNKRRGPAKIRQLLMERARQVAHPSSVAVLQMNFLGTNPGTQLTAEDQQTGRVNYFIGKDPAKWHSNIPLFGRVSYRDIYPGVDLAFHGASRRLEFDYLVSPGADPGIIALGFQGAEHIDTTAVGDLILTTVAGPVQIHKPVAYQDKDGVRQFVDARFSLDKHNRVAFALGPYDHSRQLVIDPTVTYSTYFGGDFADYGIGIAADASGNAFIAGATDSDSIPGPAGPTNNSSFDVFVTEINPTGTLVFTTLFGGSSDDFAGGIAVDSQGIYVTGTTSSSDFPVTVGAAQTAFMGGVTHGNNDAFAVKLQLNGAPIVWGTFIAGSDSDSGLGIAVDSTHNVYVVGETFSNNLGGAVGGVSPLPNGNLINLGNGGTADDGYIVKLTSTGASYFLVSYIGGSSDDLTTGVALDGGGNIFVSGETISTDLPLTAPLQNKCGTDGTCNTGASGPQDDAFIVAIHATLSGYIYETYYGGSGVDDALGIAADAAGNAFVTGNTNSSDFPTHGTPLQSQLGAANAQNAFVLELNSTGSAATYSTYLGGSGTDFGLGIAVDSSDNAYVTGQTAPASASSSDFPLLNPTQPTFGGSTDAFVSVIASSPNHLLFSTYLGGGGDEDTLNGSIEVDSSQNIYVTGDTNSGNGSTSAFPTKNSLDGTYGGGTCTTPTGNVPCPDAFITSYSPATAPDFTIAATTPAAVSPGSAGMSTVTLTSLNGYALPVTLSCAVSGGGSPAPSCSAAGSFSTNPATPTSAGATSTLTITTTGASGALLRPSNLFYASWLPIVGLSLVGFRLSSTGPLRKKLCRILLLGIAMVALSLLPGCSSSSHSTPPPPCNGCTPAGNYTVTITGADANKLSHSTQVTLTVN